MILTAKDSLAIGVTVCSVLGAFFLSYIAITNNSSTSIGKDVLSAVLPLLGSWVGTILAYYFSRDNFEAANQSLSNMVDKVNKTELKSVPVTERMIKVDEIFHKKESEINQKLVDILEKFDDSKEIWSRLPIFSDEQQIKALIHRTTIEKFIMKNYKNTDLSQKIEDLTIMDLLNDPQLKDKYDVLGESSTLADAKQKMDQLTCKDVFITKTGKQEEPVIGWITNAIIMKNAKL
jgi:putative lipase involved disintegration of autophagic bodies